MILPKRLPIAMTVANIACFMVQTYVKNQNHVLTEFVCGLTSQKMTRSGLNEV